MPKMETLKCGKVDDFVYGGTHLHLQKTSQIFVYFFQFPIYLLKVDDLSLSHLVLVQ